ncbi:unnamed protein product [Adineta steineri]|uniref:Uncharacterized protein n=1 Tax=Adineta steineri TaxID=433720 RepID=A0A814DJ63_9BILA|nr:unnamed protein product [Adineta steineri]CAF0998768.1 unnamed protein product [Adineta steineri]
MKYLTICFVLAIISYLFVLQTNAFFTGGGDAKKKEIKGQCSLYKGKCGGTLSNTCCKLPYKCAKQTKVCGKDKLCCVSEADIQRQKQESTNIVKGRNG